jgi:hypothetical protein
LEAVRVIVTDVDARIADRRIATADLFSTLVFVTHFTMLALIAMLARVLDVFATFLVLDLLVMLEFVRLCKDTSGQASDSSGDKQFLRHKYLLKEKQIEMICMPRKTQAVSAG